MLRQHQFEKVEMVSITHPDKSGEEHDRMTRCAEDVLETAGVAIPHRDPVRPAIMGAGMRQDP